MARDLLHIEIKKEEKNKNKDLENKDLENEIEKDKWVFFNYSDGNMQFVTSDSDKALMQAVNDIKEVKRVMKVDKKQAPYKYEVGGDALKRTFVERFRKNRPYIDVMPDLPDPEEQQADKPKKQKEEAVQEEQDDYE